MTEEAASVLAWYEHYAGLCDDAARATRPSYTLLQVLQSAFPSLYHDVVDRRRALGADEWACVVALLEAFYEVDLNIPRGSLREEMTLDEATQRDEFVSVLEYVVSAVVQCDDKARFVRDIMTMDDNVQVDIMAVIERVMVKTANMPVPNADDNAPDYGQQSGRTKEMNAIRTSAQDPPASPLSPSPRDHNISVSSSTRSPLHSTRNAELERLKQENDILKQDNIHIATELAELRAKYQQTESESASLRRSVEELQLQSEMDLLKRERTVRTMFEERLHTLQHQLDVVTAELEQKSAIAKDAAELRDEIDLLRPAADKLAKAETTLAKYKLKIEELGSAKEKLRRIEEANAELVEKNLALESQAAKASAVQRKLADSKEANTVIQFRVSELETQLARLTTDLDSKRRECEAAAAALTESQALINQLQRSSYGHQVEAGAVSAGPTTELAGGISELNPELMEKLARLEYENKSLRSQVDGTTSTRIEELVDELEDANRLKKSFETKYFDTSAVLTATETTLSAAEQRVKDLEAQLDQRSQELQAALEERDELRQLATRNAERIAQLTADLDEERTVFENLKQELRTMVEAHEEENRNQCNQFEAEKQQLHEKHELIQAEFDAYVASHGVLNDEANAKERALQTEIAQVAVTLGCEAHSSEDPITDQVRRLHEAAKEVKSRIETQQIKLRDAVKTQLDANRRLMAANQSIKSELVKKEAQVLQLENAVTRLDSKVELYERERARLSSGGSETRPTDAPNAGFATLVTGHAQELMEEYEKIRRELQQLHEQRAACRCRQNDNSDDGPHTAKSYLQERVRQLELAKSHAEDKKRELLLVNAKLMQDQKQLQAKNATDSKDVAQLREKLNTWMLRDERRKKEHEQFTQKLHALEADNRMLRMQLHSGAITTVSQDESPLTSQESSSNPQQENDPPETHTFLDAPEVEPPPSPMTGTLTKRKLDECAEVEDPSTEVETQAVETSTSSAPRKRRMSLFMSNRMTTALPRELEEKPSECKQQ